MCKVFTQRHINVVGCESGLCGCELRRDFGGVGGGNGGQHGGDDACIGALVQDARIMIGDRVHHLLLDEAVCWLVCLNGAYP